MKIIWSPLAIDRVSEIAVYIAQENPAAAEKWVDTVFREGGRPDRTSLKAAGLYLKPKTKP